MGEVTPPASRRFCRPFTPSFTVFLNKMFVKTMVALALPLCLYAVPIANLAGRDAEAMEQAAGRLARSGALHAARAPSPTAHLTSASKEPASGENCSHGSFQCSGQHLQGMRVRRSTPPYPAHTSVRFWGMDHDSDLRPR